MSRSVLKKHMQTCQGKKEKHKELCKNGATCRFLRNNRCSFSHPQSHIDQHPKRSPEVDSVQQDWITVRPRQRKPIWTCIFCDESIYSQDASRSHGCKMPSSECVPGESGKAKNRQETLCWWGINCQRVQNGSCWFKHIEQINMLPQQEQYWQGFPHRNPAGYQY